MPCLPLPPPPLADMVDIGIVWIKGQIVSKAASLCLIKYQLHSAQLLNNC